MAAYAWHRTRYGSENNCWNNLQHRWCSLTCLVNFQTGTRPSYRLETGYNLKGTHTSLTINFDGSIDIKLEQLPVDFRNQQEYGNTDITSAWYVTPPQQGDTPGIAKPHRPGTFTCTGASRRIHERDKQPRGGASSTAQAAFYPDNYTTGETDEGHRNILSIRFFSSLPDRNSTSVAPISNKLQKKRPVENTSDTLQFNNNDLRKNNLQPWDEGALIENFWGITYQPLKEMRLQRRFHPLRLHLLEVTPSRHIFPNRPAASTPCFTDIIITSNA